MAEKNQTEKPKPEKRPSCGTPLKAEYRNGNLFAYACPNSSFGHYHQFGE
jgi:hypothetical protein